MAGEEEAHQELCEVPRMQQLVQVEHGVQEDRWLHLEVFSLSEDVVSPLRFLHGEGKHDPGEDRDPDLLLGS